MSVRFDLLAPSFDDRRRLLGCMLDRGECHALQGDEPRDFELGTAESWVSNGHEADRCALTWPRAAYWRVSGPPAL